MSRSVNHAASRRRRKKLLSHAKGSFGSRGNLLTSAKHHVEKGWQYAYRDRRNRRRAFRSLWIVRINAAARTHGTTYSKLMSALKQKGVTVNRKILADLALHNDAAFANVVKFVQA